MVDEDAGRLLAVIEALNRKERYWLVRQATEGRFRLDPDYRTELEHTLGLSIPADAYTAMDYHLDWLATAIASSQREQLVGVPFRNEITGGMPVMTGNQEDVDLLVAFTSGGTLHLILIEAKFDSGWTNSQMNSKARRLGALFGQAGDAVPNVVPHFLITSPRRPPRLMPDAWPAWMRGENGPRWIELAVSAGRLQPRRTDDRGRANRAGEFVTLRSVRVPRDSSFEVGAADLEFGD